MAFSLCKYTCKNNKTWGRYEVYARLFSIFGKGIFYYFLMVGTSMEFFLCPEWQYCSYFMTLLCLYYGYIIKDVKRIYQTTPNSCEGSGILEWSVEIILRRYGQVWYSLYALYGYIMIGVKRGYCTAPSWKYLSKQEEKNFKNLPKVIKYTLPRYRKNSKNI